MPASFARRMTSWTRRFRGPGGLAPLAGADGGPPPADRGPRAPTSPGAPVRTLAGLRVVPGAEQEGLEEEALQGGGQGLGGPHVAGVRAVADVGDGPQGLSGLAVDPREVDREDREVAGLVVARHALLEPDALLGEQRADGVEEVGLADEGVRAGPVGTVPPDASDGVGDVHQLGREARGLPDQRGLGRALRRRIVRAIVGAPAAPNMFLDHANPLPPIASWREHRAGEGIRRSVAAGSSSQSSRPLWIGRPEGARSECRRRSCQLGWHDRRRIRRSGRASALMPTRPRRPPAVVRRSEPDAGARLHHGEREARHRLRVRLQVVVGRERAEAPSLPRRRPGRADVGPEDEVRRVKPASARGT